MFHGHLCKQGMKPLSQVQQWEIQHGSWSGVDMSVTKATGLNLIQI